MPTSDEKSREWISTVWPIGAAIVVATLVFGGAFSELRGLSRSQDRQDEEIAKLQMKLSEAKDQIAKNTALLDADRTKFSELERRLERVEQFCSSKGMPQ